MISLFIAAILLSVIFRFFSQIITFEKKMKQAREHILETSNLDIKLNTIFSQLIHKNFSKDPCFYTKDNSLFFYFDNGIDPNPLLSSVVMGTLLIDKNDDLILKITPTEANNKIFREEILMKHIKNLSFEFTKNLLNRKDPHQSTRFPIFTSWDKEENNIPAIVKIKLQNKNEENLSFDFFLPTEQSSITYFDKAK
jgi:hypothetical protein